ncbi:MAG: hypothetical protein ABI608_00185 [Rhizomicrobium sp.]
MSAWNRTREILRRLGGTPRKIKLVLVCGAWGGGTSAVAGVVAKLGAQGFGPYHHTNESRTPVSFEFLVFRDIVLRFVSEKTLELKPGAAEGAPAVLRRFHREIGRQKYGFYDRDGTIPVLFKYPLSALLIPQICEVFDTRLVYVMRSLEDIERTRLRRNWPDQYGRHGAEVIYRALHDFERLSSHPIHILRYADFLTAPAAHARDLARFAGLEPTPALLAFAADSVRS